MKLNKNDLVTFNNNGTKIRGIVCGTYLIGPSERMIIKTNNGDKFIIKKSDVITE